MTQRYWQIRGYDSSREIFALRIEAGQITYDQLKQMLKALAAKAGLGFVEIVGAYAKRRTKIADDLLAIHRKPESTTLSCGTNPHFVASVIDEEGKPIRYPKLS